MLRKLITSIASLFFVAGAVVANATPTSISASAITDSFSRPVNGKLCFAPVDATGAPAGFRVGSVQVVATPVCGLVSNGVLQSGLSVQPTPTGIYYHVTTNNRNTGAVLRDYGMTSITGSSWSLDSYDPSTSIIPAASLTYGTTTTVPYGTPASCALVGTGSVLLNCNIPQGPTGATGAPGATGATGPAGASAVGSIAGLASDGANGIAVTAKVAATTVVSSVNKQINPLAAPYNAFCDGTHNDTTAIAQAVTDAGSLGIVVIPQGSVCKVSGLTLNTYTKIQAWGAKLIPSAANQTVLTIGGGATLQTNGKMVIEGLEIDGSSQTGTTGLTVGNHAQVELIAPNIHDCGTAGLVFNATQFADIVSPRLYNNYVGAKLYSDATAGGANSINFMGGQIVGNTVGVIQYTPNLFQGSNYFYNTAFLTNSVAAVAVIGSSNSSKLYMVGGAPESNASGAASVTIDGNTITRATVFANNYATVYVDHVFIGDAQANPWAIATNHSSIEFADVAGYGQTFGNLATGDSTSNIGFSGSDSAIGIAGPVRSWPESLKTVAQFSLFGAPIYTAGGVINEFSGNASAPALTPAGGSSSGTTTDALWGPINTITHAASAGSAGSNRWTVNNIVTSPPASAFDVLCSFMIKSSVDTNYFVGFFGTTSNATISLKAGKWTRVVMYKSNQTASTNFTLVAYPNDSAGATISVANVQVMTGLTGTAATEAAFSQVLSTGAVGGSSVLNMPVSVSAATVSGLPSACGLNTSSAGALQAVTCTGTGSHVLQNAPHLTGTATIDTTQTNTVQTDTTSTTDLNLNPARSIYMVDRSGNGIGRLAGAGTAFNALNWLMPYQISDLSGTLSGTWIGSNAARAGAWANLGGSTPGDWYSKNLYVYGLSGFTKIAGPTTADSSTITLPAGGGTVATQAWVVAQGYVTSGGGSGITNVQITTGTTAIAALSCTSATATTMTGVATTSVVDPPTPTSDVSSTTGWSPGGTLYFSYWVTTNTLNWRVCNSSASASVTPGASVTWNVGAK